MKWLGLILLCTFANASTFVGNGGNVLDIEIASSRNVLSETLKFLLKNKSDDICRCPHDDSSQKICNSLNELSESQVKFCQEFIENQSEKWIALLREQKDLKIVWTEQPLAVKEYNRVMSVDAIANHQDKSITINKAMYGHLKIYEKNFLLMHEVGHLVPYKGSFVKDEQAVGPFKDMLGGRQLLNAVAATVTLNGIKHGIVKGQERVLKVSKRSKIMWLGLEYQQSDIKDDNNRPYSPEKFSGFGVLGRYQLLDRVSLGFSLYKTDADKKILDTINSKIEMQSFGIRFGYRFYLIEDLLSDWGQSYLLTELGIDQVEAKFTQVENVSPVLKDSQSKSFTQLSFGASYYVPLQNSIWIYGGLNYSLPQVKFSLYGSNYNQPYTSVKIGVAYGF